MTNKNEEKEDDNEDYLIYHEYEKKYDLPKYNDIKKLLDISCFDDKDLVFNIIKKKILDKIDKYIEILDTIIQPDTTITAMYEMKYISEEERLNAFKIYKKLMHHYRKIQILEIENNEEKDAKFINLFFREFDEIKNQLLEIIKKQKECWKNNENTKDDVLAYFG
ncbi:MAG: hypothetical protein ACOC3X_02465 [Nanoarchaeota archaeon]